MSSFNLYTKSTVDGLIGNVNGSTGPTGSDGLSITGPTGPTGPEGPTDTSQLVKTGYSSVGVSGPILIGALALNTWVPLTGYNLNLIQSPVGVTYTPPNGFTFLKAGVWTFMLKIALDHDEQNSSRRLSFRVFNTTTGQPTAYEFAFGVGRNVNATSMSASFVADVLPGEVGNVFELQVASVQGTFSGVSNIGSVFSLTYNDS